MRISMARHRIEPMEANLYQASSTQRLETVLMGSGGQLKVGAEELCNRNCRCAPVILSVAFQFPGFGFSPMGF